MFRVRPGRTSQECVPDAPIGAVGDGSRARLAARDRVVLRVGVRALEFDNHLCRGFMNRTQSSFTLSPEAGRTCRSTTAAEVGGELSLRMGVRASEFETQLPSNHYPLHESLNPNRRPTSLRGLRPV